MDYESDVELDELDESDEAAATAGGGAGDPVVGRVLQRYVIERLHPPSDFVLADPTGKEPVLRLQLARHSADGKADERVRVAFWGTWCDKLGEKIQRDDQITIVGATLDFDEPRCRQRCA